MSLFTAICDFLGDLFGKSYTKEEASALCNAYMNDMHSAFKELGELCKDSEELVEHDEFEKWKNNYRSLYNNVCDLPGRAVRKTSFISEYNQLAENFKKKYEFLYGLECECQAKCVAGQYKYAIGDRLQLFNGRFVDVDSVEVDEFKSKWAKYYTISIELVKQNIDIDGVKQFKKIFDNLDRDIAAHNKNYVSSVIQPVEGINLDDQQLECICKDKHNHLVIAGAGTGKTTTIIGRIKYLLATSKCDYNEILVLSFTRKSAEEMCERIKKETGKDIVATTFHSLGLDIIKQVEKKSISIYSKSLTKFCEAEIKEKMKNSEYLHDIMMYLYVNPEKFATQFDFTNEKEYREYLIENPPITMKKENVKGYCELEIANFLYKNNIKYTYEKSYPFRSEDAEFIGYHPDFYLDDYDIYIEFFGIDKQNKVPEYFKSRHGKSASEEYLDGMKWKREFHKKNDTILVEVSFGDYQDGKLLERLKDKLLALNVVFEEKTTEELWNEIAVEADKNIINLAELMGTVITLMKTDNYTLDDVYRKIEDTPSRYKNANLKLMNLISPVYKSYCDMLMKNDEIDFNDMINTAANYVRQNKYSHNYKYVIVDEYQDIAKSRVNLLQALREQKDYALFCVGDDWQSIYRFAGSDVGFILNFAKYWGETEQSRIETTYRFPKKLIEITGNFVMKNPYHVKKSLKSPKNDDGFPLEIVSGYTDRYALQFSEEKIKSLPHGSTVYFIGRYNWDKDIFKDSSMSVHYSNRENEQFIVTLPSRLDLKMEFMTAHKSKGLQADYVFIINTKKKGMGFPSKIQDSKIMTLLLENSDDFEFAEERRLFYVAMTRAKKKVFFLTVKDNVSEFVMEINEKYEKEIKDEQWKCPWCGGKLTIKNGKNGKFIGCCNYRKTGCKYTKNITSKG